MSSRFSRRSPEAALPATWPELPETHGPVAGGRQTDAAPAAVSLAAPSRTAERALFIPEHYEANYAYPLLVWIVDETASHGFSRMMRQISERNYFGMSVPNEPLESLESRVYDAVARLRRRYHLHTERVYVAGIASGGTQALRLGLMRPEWFGGIAAVSARCPAEEHLLQRYDELRGKPVFLGVAPDDGAALATDVCRLQRLLWSAGMDVSACAADAGPAPSASILRQIDRWIMNVME